MVSADRLALGIDMGGTNMRIAVVDNAGRVVAARRLPSRPELGPDDTVARMACAAREVIDSLPPDRRTAVAAVGLATPGPVDTRRGVIVTTPNLPGWREVPVAAMLSIRLGLPVRHVRDANAALAGEVWLGAARGCGDVLLLTLGTGIGGAALAGGRLLTGRDGFAGEFGHITVDPDGPECGCGNRGCLEALASGSALRRRTGMEAGALFTAARSGDPEARAAVTAAARALGTGLAALANTFNPELIVVGGGMSAGWPLLEAETLAEMRRRAFAPVTAGLGVATARLGDNAGILGAARLALLEADR